MLHLNMLLLLQEEYYVFNAFSFQEIVSNDWRGLPVMWRCSTCGHMYKASALARSKGLCCPSCSCKALTSVNNAAAIHPYLETFYDTEKNERLLSSYLPSSQEQVYWKCHECGHTSFQSISCKVRKPYCTRCLTHDVPYGLRITHPELEDWYDFERNAEGMEVHSYRSYTPIALKCPDCSESFLSSVRDFIANPQCPSCQSSPYPSLAEEHPALAERLNLTATGCNAHGLVSRSSQLAVWYCESCPTSYKDRVSNLISRGRSLCHSCR